MFLMSKFMFTLQNYIMTIEKLSIPPYITTQLAFITINVPKGIDSREF